MSTSTSRSAEATVTGDVRTGEYGSSLIAVEPGGAEMVPERDRHGRPLQLLWTWLSPNLEFATVFLGVLAVGIVGLSFWQAVGAIALGTGLGAISHGVLSSRGPAFGVPQMVLSRIAFGYRGNALPAGLNALVAGIGWFAVNSVSGAFALASLTGMPSWVGLLIVVAVQLVVAFFGHNLVQAFERYALPFLGLVFLAACISTFTQADYASPAAQGTGAGIGGFLVIVGATFGYAAGWNPYAADYTRYLPTTVSSRMAGVYAGSGIFVSCLLLETAGAASVAVLGYDPDVNPTATFTDHLGGVLGSLTLLAIALGAISANALNIYSGALSFTAIGITLPVAKARAVTALAFGAVGLVLALFGLQDAGASYQGFLLVISYWIGPWLGVYFTDWLLRRGHRVDGFLFDTARNPYAGWVSMLVGIVVSVLLFSNESRFVGVVAEAVPAVGDITFFVGFLLAGGLYAVLLRTQQRREPADSRLVITGGAGS